MDSTTTKIDKGNSFDKHYMPALTGVRAIAAYMVYFHHFNPLSHYREATGIKQMLYSLIYELHAGVTIFFVLSGFLICYRYYNQAIAIDRKWFGIYLMNRVARIYPMFFILTIITFVFIRISPETFDFLPTGITAGQSVQEYLTLFLLNISLLKAFFDEYKFTGISQAWSLTVEECFYLLAPFFMLFIRRNRWALIILPVITLLFMAGLVLVIGSLDFHGLFHDFKFMLNFTFFGRCLEFFAGMALAVFIFKTWPVSTGQRTYPRFLFTLLGVISIIGCLIVLSLISGVWHSEDSIVGTLFSTAILPLAVVTFFYGLIVEKTWLQSLLSNKLFDVLGKSSYIFYLIHVGVISVAINNYVSANPAIRTLLLIIASVGMYYFIESPLHKLLRPRQPAK